MRYTCIFTPLILLLTACFPKEHKERMEEGIKQMQLMMVENNFQHAIALVELHKLRTGNYPERLSEIKFVPMMDSMALAEVIYTKLPEGYELNVNAAATDFSGNTTPVVISLPAEFWNGLGCVKSNLKK